MIASQQDRNERQTHFYRLRFGIDPHSRHSRHHPILLCERPNGTHATVESLVAPSAEIDDATLRILRDLGFIAGEPMHLLRRGPGGCEPLAVLIGATLFALRRRAMPASQRRRRGEPGWKGSLMAGILGFVATSSQPTKLPPSAKCGFSSSSTRRASRVLPTPPGPTSVSRRTPGSANSAAMRRSSLARPMKSVSAAACGNSARRVTPTAAGRLSGGGGATAVALEPGQCRTAPGAAQPLALEGEPVRPGFVGVVVEAGQQLAAAQRQRRIEVGNIAAEPVAQI
jgi:ferrous iron transport protein A